MKNFVDQYFEQINRPDKKAWPKLVEVAKSFATQPKLQNAIGFCMKLLRYVHRRAPEISHIVLVSQFAMTAYAAVSSSSFLDGCSISASNFTLLSLLMMSYGFLAQRKYWLPLGRYRHRWIVQLFFP